MKISKIVFATFLIGSMGFISCGDANKPVQTASEYSASGEDSAGAASGAGATANQRDSTVDNSGKQNLPDQMVPENSSVSITPSTNPK